MTKQEAIELLYKTRDLLIADKFQEAKALLEEDFLIKKFTAPTNMEWNGYFMHCITHPASARVKRVLGTVDGVKARREADISYGFYERNGWKVSRYPMKDWKRACANWVERSASKMQDYSYKKSDTAFF